MPKIAKGKVKKHAESRINITDAMIKQAKVKDKSYPILDAIPGLSIIISPTGTKVWSYRKRSMGVRAQVRIGYFDNGYTVAQAREAAIQIANYVDYGTPITVRHLITDRQLRMLNPEAIPPVLNFKELYLDWYANIAVPELDERYLKRINNQMMTHVIPVIGDKDLAKITSSDIIEMARKLQNKGNIETAHRIVALCSRIFRYGIILKKVQIDPAAMLHDVLPSSASGQHMPSIPISDTLRIGELIYKARREEGLCFKMLLLQAYTFVRPTELRLAVWDEIDIQNALWRLPPERMKMSSMHLVPLSKQVISILKSLQTGKTIKYVFPFERDPDSGKPIADNAVLNALKKLGFKTGEMSAHGFRSIASTILNESGKFTPDAIERQLSHVPSNKVRASYNYAQYMPERTAMMQWYAEYLDNLECEYTLKIANDQGWSVTVDNKEKKSKEDEQLSKVYFGS